MNCIAICNVLVQDHVKDECQMVEISCPNKGCSELVQKGSLDKHLQQCEYRMLNCQWCKKDVRYDQQQVRRIAEYYLMKLSYIILLFHTGA